MNNAAENELILYKNLYHQAYDGDDSWEPIIYSTEFSGEKSDTSYTFNIVGLYACNMSSFVTVDTILIDGVLSETTSDVLIDHTRWASVNLDVEAAGAYRVIGNIRFTTDDGRVFNFPYEHRFTR
ncbi:MAG: hypothetical protein JKX84_06325 [Flavobacteriales bacterium]|nr:hypothetical protein [Flavobacteriales bacterium]